ncbi:hypothetical protein POI8812_03128 [Pontivivens insulae]|uniref:Uncharacterized protein n=1 Tax=Pontivivens insulae TaxID=1639689 RepID=A0A2R8AFC9_9RHOB|nr:hypothetical protein DFR53_2742 [Pontivivens insulae]SPF30785.1 hypothetical protein POI8812_03128 [Pontivivens insulae]
MAGVRQLFCVRARIESGAFRRKRKMTIRAAPDRGWAAEPNYDAAYCGQVRVWDVLCVSLEKRQPGGRRALPGAFGLIPGFQLKSPRRVVFDVCLVEIP